MFSLIHSLRRQEEREETEKEKKSDWLKKRKVAMTRMMRKLR